MGSVTPEMPIQIYRFWAKKTQLRTWPEAQHPGASKSGPNLAVSQIFNVSISATAGQLRRSSEPQRAPATRPRIRLKFEPYSTYAHAECNHAVREGFRGAPDGISLSCKIFPNSVRVEPPAGGRTGYHRDTGRRVTADLGRRDLQYLLADPSSAARDSGGEGPSFYCTLFVRLPSMALFERYCGRGANDSRVSASRT